MEICFNNAWGTICSDGFGSQDAEFICRQTTYPFNGEISMIITVLMVLHIIMVITWICAAGTVVFRQADQFGQGSGPIFLNQLNCNGDEDQVLACGRGPLGLHSCSHAEDTGVRCIGRCGQAADLLCYLFNL